MGCLHDWFASVCFPQQKQTCSHLQYVYLFSINFNEGPSSTLTFVALKSQSAIKVAPIALKEAAGKDVEATHFLQYKLFFHLDN